MKRQYYVLIGVIALLAVLAVSYPDLALAQTTSVKEGLGVAAKTAYGDGAPVPLAVIIGKLISTLLGLTGAIFLILTVYGGLTYMTAGGDEKKVTKAKSIITQSLIGIIIIVAAYALSSFVVSALVAAT